MSTLNIGLVRSTLNIGLVGQVSSGKSSFLNALAGNFIANVSLLRETYEPQIWEFNQSAPTPVNQIYKQNQETHKKSELYRANNTQTHITINGVPTISGSFSSLILPRTFNVIDFPGINDSEDTDGRFYRYIENNIDFANLLIYITSADSAFTLASEVEKFQKILELVKSRVAEGVYIVPIIVVNKYDSQDDDYDEIIKNFKKTFTDIRVFRVSAHQLLCHHIKSTEEEFIVPKHIDKEFKKILRMSGYRIQNKMLSGFDSGDYDQLLEFITNIDVAAKEYEYSINSLLSYNPESDLCKKLVIKLDKLYTLEPNLSSRSEYLEYIKKYLRIDTNILFWCKFVQTIIKKDPNVINVVKECVSTNRRLLVLLNVILLNNSHEFDLEPFVSLFRTRFRLEFTGSISSDIEFCKCINISPSLFPQITNRHFFLVDLWILSLKSTNKNVVALQKLLIISRAPVNKLFKTHMLRPDYYTKFFTLVPNLYESFRTNIISYCNSDAPLEHRLFNMEVNYDNFLFLE